MRSCVRSCALIDLLQVLSLVAMERPVSLDAEAIRDEKVKVLRAVRAIKLSDLVLGQYTASKDGSKPAYTDDKTVPAGSRCATFATAILRIDNERWDGVPFILKCGKALDERKAVIRIQFKSVPGQLFSNAARNELVIEIQPNESTYLKFNVKKPGLANGVEQSELDLSYSTRWSGTCHRHGVDRPDRRRAVLIVSSSCARDWIDRCRHSAA